MGMRHLIAFSVILGLLLILDVYTWQGLKRTVGRRVFKFFKWFIPITTFLFFAGFMIALFRSNNGIHNGNYLLNLITGFTFGVFIAKLIIALPFLIEDLVRFTLYIFKRFKAHKTDHVKIPSRRKFVRNIALSVAAIPLAGTIYAITRGKYKFHVKRMTLHFDDLPASFDGVKIAQFSDFHAGSFDSVSAVRDGLALINQEKPDIITFTGDLVNNRSVECAPYEPMLKALKAPMGKFAVRGNHDYGDYKPFLTRQEEKENLENFERIFKDADFKLLDNETYTLTKNNESLHLVGVENWGNPPFPRYGDLNKAVEGLPKNDFSILLSHDPDHWEYEARLHKKKFHLTLSGHTHGSQFGVDIPGFKWSPVKYKYKRWMGLYKEDNQYLYVSKGFGFLGFPGRFGIYPEIVIIELKQKTV